VARASGRLAEALKVTLGALQGLLAGGHMRPLLRVLEGARDEALQAVAGNAITQAVVLVAMAIDATVGLHADALGVARLAENSRMRTYQWLRVREVLTAPALDVMAVGAIAAPGLVWRHVTVVAFVAGIAVALEAVRHRRRRDLGDVGDLVMHDLRMTIDAVRHLDVAAVREGRREELYGLELIAGVATRGLADRAGDLACHGDRFFADAGDVHPDLA